MKKSRLRNISRRPVRRKRAYILRSDAKKNKAAKRYVKLGFYVILLALLSYGAVRGWEAAKDFVSSSEYLKIQSIEIDGNKNVLRGEIIALLPFEAGDSLLSGNISKTENSILKLKPEIKKIEVTRKLKKVVIRVKERIPVCFIMLDGKRMGLDYDNIPFPLRGEYAKEHFPEIEARSSSDREEILQFVKLFSTRAKEHFDRSVSFYFESVDDVAVKLENGTRIIWGKNEGPKFDDKYLKLRAVLEDAGSRFAAIDYINMNYLDSGRVLVKPGALSGRQNTAAQVGH